MPLIEVIEIKTGKTKYVGEWALKDPKQLANLGFKLADDSQSQAISDAESISAAVKKKLESAAAAKNVLAQPAQEDGIEPVHELVNPLDEGYENIQEAESPYSHFGAVISWYGYGYFSTFVHSLSFKCLSLILLLITTHSQTSQTIDSR